MRLRALLLRDFVAYDHRLRTGKDFAPLWAARARASSRRSGQQRAPPTLTGSRKAPSSSPGTATRQPVEYDENGKSVLELHQEAYAFDPGAGSSAD